MDGIRRITAGELRPGNSILGRNGHGNCSLTVTSVHRDGDTITAGTRLGDRYYSAADVVVIWQD